MTPSARRVRSGAALRARHLVGGPPGAAPRALPTCAEGDDHTFGLSLTDLVPREAGWVSIWAGRRTPLAELGPALSRSRARLLAVSASEASRDVAGLRAQAEVLGGSGAWPGRPRTGARFTDLESFTVGRSRIEGLDWASVQRYVSI